MFNRRTFLGSLAALFGLSKVHAAPPENLPGSHAAPPEPKADESKDPGWGPTHVHDWISQPSPDIEVSCEVQVCSHPECYAYRVYNYDPTTSIRRTQVHEYAPNEILKPPVIFNHHEYMEMSRHIVAYVDKTDAVVLSWDDPMTRRIGYTAFGKELPRTVQWEIPLTKLKNIQEPDPSKRALLSTYLLTMEGRMKLAAAMMNAGKNRRAMRLG